jgi:hypothetical protein
MATGILRKTEKSLEWSREGLEIMDNVHIHWRGLDWWEVWKTTQNNLETLWNDKWMVKDPKDEWDWDGLPKWLIVKEKERGLDLSIRWKHVNMSNNKHLWRLTGHARRAAVIMLHQILKQIQIQNMKITRVYFLLKPFMNMHTPT